MLATFAALAAGSGAVLAQGEMVAAPAPSAPVAAATSAAPPGVAAGLATLDYRLQARALAPGVWVVEGANADFSPANGCNIINTAFVGTGKGVVVINTGPSRLYGEQLRALIARTTAEPVREVLHLNLHPDYFLGNQAFADVPRRATETTRSGIRAEAASYETNLYRLCGDWMKGTATVHPDTSFDTGTGQGSWRVGTREFAWLALAGHTASDLVLVERSSGVVFAGGLVFADRVPTTPHADIPAWLASLDRLQAISPRLVVPSHGPVHGGNQGLEQTRRYLQWLDASLTRWAAQGLEMTEVLQADVPAEFRRWAAFDTEFLRNVVHLYPRYEQRALQGTGR